jgi:hypothetical protein
MSLYPVEITMPYLFNWKVGDRIERTSTNSGDVYVGTAVRVPQYSQERTGPVAIAQNNVVLIYGPAYEHANDYTYRLLSREYAPDYINTRFNTRYDDLSPQDKRTIDNLICRLAAR